MKGVLMGRMYRDVVIAGEFRVGDRDSNQPLDDPSSGFTVDDNEVIFEDSIPLQLGTGGVDGQLQSDGTDVTLEALAAADLNLKSDTGDVNIGSTAGAVVVASGDVLTLKPAVDHNATVGTGAADAASLVVAGLAGGTTEVVTSDGGAFRVVCQDNGGSAVTTFAIDSTTKIAHIADEAQAAGANPTKAEYDSLVGKFNSLLALLEDVGFIATS